MVKTRNREQIADTKKYLMGLKERLLKKKQQVEVEKLDIEMDGHNQ